MLKVGDQVFGGNAVIVEVSNNGRYYKVTSLWLGDPQTGVPAIITFDEGQAEDDIRRFFGVSAS